MQVYSGTREKKAHSAVTVHESLALYAHETLHVVLQDELSSARATCDEQASALADLTLRAARAEAAATDALERLASASADGLVVSDALTVRCGIRCEPMHCTASQPASHMLLCAVCGEAATRSRERNGRLRAPQRGGGAAAAGAVVCGVIDFVWYMRGCGAAALVPRAAKCATGRLQRFVS